MGEGNLNLDLKRHKIMSMGNQTRDGFTRLGEAAGFELRVIHRSRARFAACGVTTSPQSVSATQLVADRRLQASRRVTASHPEGFLRSGTTPQTLGLPLRAIASLFPLLL